METSAARPGATTKTAPASVCADGGRTAAVARRLSAALGVLSVCVALTACDLRPPELPPIPPVDITAYEPSVRAAIAKAQAEVDRLAREGAGRDKLADAYGELAMRYHVHDVTAAAEAAYRSAHLLAPKDKRWPYLLGHLYNDTARPAQALKTFEGALEIDAHDVPLLSSLGAVALRQGDVERARKAYEQLLKEKGGAPLANYGLGKVAMAERNYPQAIERFEETLKLVPAASRVRAPLASAYRAAGDTAKAEAALNGFSPNGPEPSVADPLADLLDSKVASFRGLVKRGQRFGQVGDFESAAAAFKGALEANPNDAEALANYGISLANLGRLDEAVAVLGRSVESDPKNAVAQMSLGVIFDRQGKEAPARERYRQAVESDPHNADAQVYLADLEMRAGRLDEAVRHYRQALEEAPTARVRLSLALAQVAAGRYRDARSELEAGLAAAPAHPLLTNALARVLAASPDDGVREGPRALALSKALFEKTRNPDVGQSYAMAMAETGDFEHAVRLQQETIIAYERMGAPALKPYLERNLAAYRQQAPSREPWAKDDPVFRPRSPAVAMK